MQSAAAAMDILYLFCVFLRFSTEPFSTKPQISKTFFNTGLDEGLHSGLVVSTVASQREGSRFHPHLGPFSVLNFGASLRIALKIKIMELVSQRN